MRFTERHQRYGVISRIKREGSVLAGALFVLGEAERGGGGQGVLGTRAVTGQRGKQGVLGRCRAGKHRGSFRGVASRLSGTGRAAFAKFDSGAFSPDSLLGGFAV